MYNKLDLALMKDDVIDKKWCELDSKIKNSFTSYECVSRIDGQIVNEGECIVDLNWFLSVPGEITDGEIIIKDDAEIYMQCDDVYFNEELEKMMIK